jgi:hypothetical protein
MRGWARASLLLAGCLVLFCSGGPRRRPVQRGAPEVPAAFQSLYTFLDRSLDGLDRYLDSQAPPARRSMIFSAELLPANANRGPALLAPHTMEGVNLYLDRLQEIGVGGVTLSLAYPQLLPEFPRSSEYIAFYRDVAREVHRRKLKLSVGIGVLFANTAFSDVSIDYSTVTARKLAEGKRAMAVIVIREMSPHYLALGSEPDTEAALTGVEELNSPEGFTEMVRFILKDLDRGSTRMGAGIGSWGDRRIAESLARNTSVDFIDIHIYPIWKEALQNVALTAQMARRHGKAVTVDEAWLYKAVPGEATNIAANEKLFSRDVFSFWSPLDQRFLTSTTRLSQMEGVEVFTPFWTNYFFGSLEYSAQTAARPYRELAALVNEEAVKNIVAGRLTPTGRHYQQLIRAAME